MKAKTRFLISRTGMPKNMFKLKIMPRKKEATAAVVLADLVGFD
jgi:hypothetical protein